MKAFITLTTDFGERDGYVGQMKGRILGINPEASIVDITHDISPYSVTEAALVLKAVVRQFDFPSIHVAVVDPGVGGERRAIVIRFGSSYLIGPDNGIFSPLIDELGDCEARSIENSDFMSSRISRTFHGRDIFAPAAATLSLGHDFSGVGPPAPDLVKLNLREKIKKPGIIIGSIIHVDRFGNLVSNIEAFEIEGKRLRVECGHIIVEGLTGCYSDSLTPEPIALVNSFNLLEIALPGGNASEGLGLKVGEMVRATLKDF